LATHATMDMASDSPIVGHGAGGFRYLFPRYQQQYPSIFMEGNSRLFWEYAHNDYAQLLAELGVVGVGLLLLGLIAVVVCAVQVNLFGQPSLLLILGGPIVVATTAAVDFPMHNPAVLFTTVAVVVLVLRWAQLSRRA